MRVSSAVLKATLLALALLTVILGVRGLTKLQSLSDYDNKVALHVDEATNIVRSSLNLNFHALRDIDVVLSLATATGSSNTLAFHRYVEGTEMFDEFPALRGMAVFDFVTSNQLQGLVAKRNAERGRHELGYPPLLPKELAEGNEHAIITMIAPLVRGINQLGADILSRDRSVILREAMETRQLTISPPFELFTGETAVALFWPIYSQKDADAPEGFVATALSTDAFLSGLKSQLAPYGLELSVSDLGPSHSAENTNQPGILLGSNLTATEGIFQRNIEVGGRIWQLKLRSIQVPPKLAPIDFQSLLAAAAAALAGFLLYRTLQSADTLVLEVAKRTAELDRERQDALKNSRLDDLTGLLNRRGLDAAFLTRISEPKTAAPTLISFDLDNFKQINDTLGHASGDDLLRAFAARLRNVCPQDAILTRFGGDEFGVLLFEPKEIVIQTAEAIVDWARTAHVIGGHLMRFGTSAGIAEGSLEDCDLAELVVNADIALYAAKDRGRDQVRLFDDDMRQRVIESKTLADDIWRGLENDEFVPYFQTQHDAKTHALSGVEILVRWLHPERGVVPPGAFLEVAGKIGATKIIDRRVLEMASASVHRLEARGMSIPKFSVNVSLNRLLEEDVMESIGSLPVTNAKLTLEILESDFLDDPSDLLLWRLDQLREAGVGLEVDDFGSGRASIIALKRLNPDRLKIDKGLILPLSKDPTLKPLVSSIVEMGQSLGIAVTAEGVETAEHAEIVAELGVDTLQGFHFCMPVSEEKLAESRIAA